MKKCLSFAFCLLFSVAMGARAQSAPPSAPPGLDHFLCYYTPQTAFMPMPLQLEDQFDAAIKQVEEITDLRIVRFCNPVRKSWQGITTPILKPADHLTVYLLNPQPITPRRVLVRNQFGNQLLAVNNALSLAVPTGKALSTPAGEPPPTPPIPTDLDHYKCYGASGRVVNAFVTLTDQFLPAATARVLEPIAFCNPVQKTVISPTGAGGTPTPIQNPEAHLTCYTITPAAFSGTIFINNQFTAGTANPLTVAQADVLCVPSFKLLWAVVPPPGTPGTTTLPDELGP